MRRHVLNAAAGLSLLLCIFCALIAFANERIFVEGAVAMIDGREQIIHEPQLSWYAKAYGVAAIAFALPPGIWFLRRNRLTRKRRGG